ncbi:MAG: hydrogenase nickel incorporation protein HypA [Candidatus Bathyarchaeia archaeon]
MHEWALAESVISTVSQIAKKEGLREVSEVKIVVGELQQVELDIFEFALSQLKTPELENTKFSIKVSKAQLLCRVCGHKWNFEKENLSVENAEAIHFLPEVAHTYIRCPKCGSPDFEVMQGRGIWLESIKGVK